MSEQISSKQYQQLTKRSNKYGAQRIRVDGHTFPSKKEANRYCELKRLQDTGQIENLELQPVFPLIIDDKPVLIRSKRYRNGRAAKYTADFRYRQGGKVIVEDTKSPATRTEAAALRIAIAETIYGIRVVEV